MKFIKITVFILMLSVTFAYADDNLVNTLKDTIASLSL